jgi:transketolase
MEVRSTLSKSIDTVRLLASDAVQKAKSGHPGMPMGCADFAFTLWHKFLRHNPADPGWLGRDRFVLSAGHGSMLLYSLLHLFEYDLPMEELKNFRQWKSRTPGHPEYGHTPGVEVTTGPLGTGFASAVGMAIAAKQLAAQMDNTELFDQRIFVLSGDGCMMEGVTSEAASLAGHNKLDNLVVFYDSNGITIEGSTSLAFSEDVGKRFKAYGWHVVTINGQNVSEIENALAEAVSRKGAPVLIIGTTTIGYGAPNKAGSHSVHGEPLGEEETAAAKAALGFNPDQHFVVPEDVRQLCHERVAELKQQAQAWDEKLNRFRQEHPQKAALLDLLVNRTVPADILPELLATIPAKDDATRKTAGLSMQRAAALVPALTGGAADLNPSTKTHLEEESDFAPANRAGRNVHFGVREFCMGLCANGMALYGTAIPFTATFAVFSDFMKPALRLAALQRLHAVFVFTHDSIFVGEDGPTHQPIEQLAMCRSIPGMTVIRPAEAYEAAHAWTAALQAQGPVCLFLTRQTVKNIGENMRDRIDVQRGAYVLSDDENFDLLLIATGSEVGLAMEAANILRTQNRRVRVVSMPSWELFEAQSQDYRNSIIPPRCRKRVTIEAATTFGWQKYAGDQGLMIGIDHFGDSAPASVLAEKYGLTPAAVAKNITEFFG